MNYLDIFRQAYTLVIRKPLMWLFGLVLLGGFNLSLVNFAAIVPRAEFEVWPFPANLIGVVGFSQILPLALGVIATFLVCHLVKVGFVSVTHRLLHAPDSKLCRLCGYTKDKPAPYLTWWLRVMVASLITIALTAGVSVAMNAMLEQADTAGTAAILVNFVFLIVVTCIIGTWNAFTGYFIILHDMSFRSAANAAFDLLTLKFRSVLEFVVLLSIIYTLSVIIGQALIGAWQNGFNNILLLDVRVLFLIAFIVWSAVNNLFFNIAFLIFFDKAVRATPSSEENVSLAQIP